MSSLPGRGCVRIVGPLDPKREKELTGGLQNAIDRGSTPEAAKQSFLNAGYIPEEIEKSLLKINPVEVAPTTKTPSKVTEAVAPVATTPTATKVLPTNAQVSGEGSSKKLIIIVSVIILSILGGAGALGLYWDRIFG